MVELLPSGKMQAKLEKFKLRRYWNWRVEADFVYYFVERESGLALHSHDLNTGAEHKIRNMPESVLALDFARQKAIVAVPQASEVDIGSLQLR